MWWTLAVALAGPATDESLGVVLDQQATEDDRVKAARTLGRLSQAEAQEVVTPLAEVLDGAVTPKLARAVRRALFRMGATTAWTKQLESTDPAVRSRAAAALGHAGLAVAGPALVARLDDHDPFVRAAAAGALAGYPDAGAVPGLSDRLSDPDIRVRLAASRTLGYLGGEEAAEALLRARLIESDAVVRQYLDAALGHISDHRTPPR